MADTNVRVIVNAVDNASNVLKTVGKNIQSTLGKQAKTDVSGLTGAVGELGSAFGGTVAAIGTTALVAAGVAAAFVGVGIALKPMLEAAGESQRVMTQTNAVLRSTGGIAGMSAEEVRKLATEMQRTTPINDEAAQAAENMLLTFTAIGHEIFPQVTKAVADMATAMNGGMVPSEQELIDTSIQVGKALNDPVEGITALKRVGVQFSDAQRQVIQRLVDSNQGLEAQKLILAELNREFGGSSTAALGTYGGAMANLKNKFDDVSEAVGTAFLPVAMDLANALSGALTGAADFLNAHMVQLQAGVISVVGAFKVLIQIAIGAANIVGAALSGQWNAVGDAINKTVTNVNGTIKKTQQQIQDVVLASLNKQATAANKAYNGTAIAHSKASQSIQKDMEKETETYEKELAKRNAQFDQSLADMVFAHIDKRNSLINDLEDENKQYDERMKDRVDSFSEKMDQMVSSHKDKMQQITDQLTSEDENFNEKMTDQKDQYQEKLNDMKTAHEQKVQTLSRQIDKETAYGKLANNEKAEDLRIELADEIAAYTAKTTQVTAEQAKETLKLQTEHDKRVIALQAELAAEDLAFVTAKEKAAADDQKETLRLQEQHNARTADFQKQIDAENAILNKHQAEVAKAKDKARDDDITRLIKQHETENAENLANHLQKMKDFSANGSSEGAAYGGALQKELDKANKTVETQQKDSGKKAGANYGTGILDGAIQAGENLIKGFLDGINNQAKRLQALVGKPSAGTLLNYISPDIYNIAKKLSPDTFKQTGGIVPGPIGAAVPIIAHAGERITPTDLARGGNSGGGGVVFNVTVGLYAGSETEKRQIAKQLYGALLQVAQSQHKTVQEFMGG